MSMTYFQDFIHALKGVAVPVALIMFGGMLLSKGPAPLNEFAGMVALISFLAGITWVVYLSFFSRD